MGEQGVATEMGKSSKLKTYRMTDLVDPTKTHEDYPKPEDWGRLDHEPL